MSPSGEVPDGDVPPDPVASETSRSHSADGRTPWFSLFREAAAVLLAILIAFWLDAWWEDRGDRRQLEDQLEAVEVELAAALDEVDRTLLPAYLGQMERFLALEVSDVAGLPPDSAARAMRQLGIWTFDTGLATTRSVAASPLLAELEPDLVPTLLVIPQLVDDMQEDAARVEQWRGWCLQRLTELGLYRSMWLISEGREEEAELGASEILIAQVSDPEYRSCIAVLHVQRDDYSTEVAAIGEAVRTAQAAIANRNQ